MIALPKTLVLVGLMGAGKSAIGRRLGEQINVPFADSDAEIEERQGCSVSDIFEYAGEPAFRKMERETIAADLERPPHILATGGGAFIQPETRAIIKARGISVWLKADIEVLLERVSRKSTRPLLEQGDKHTVLARLMEERYPIYAEANIVVRSDESPHQQVIDNILTALENYVRANPPA